MIRKPKRKTPRHMEKANLVLEEDGRKIRLLVDFKEYQQFLLRNPDTPHKLECSDPVCHGDAYAHGAARDRRANANHGYTEEGFSHKKGTATPDCFFSHKDSRNFDGLPQPNYAKKMRGKVRALLEQPKNEALIKGDLQVMLGKKADVDQHFRNLVRAVCDYPVLLTRPRLAAAIYAPKIKPFTHVWPNHTKTTVRFMEEDQQRTRHTNGTRIALIPKNITLVRADTLKSIYDRSFEIDVSHRATAIIRHTRSPQERAHTEIGDRARPVPATLQMNLPFSA